MNARALTFLAAGLLATLFAQSTQAAVTVIGNNTLAQSCFQYAEIGGSAANGIAVCSEALDTQPLAFKDRAATLINRGILRTRTGDTENAVADYNEGIRMNPKLGEAYVDRGAAMISMKKWDDALRDINQGIALGTKRLHIAYYDRAIVQEEMGDVRAAYDDYKKAADLEPGFTLATQQLERFHVVVRKSGGA
ncbi:MAG TPA: hypothetical protein VHW02_07290 [Rhizomicrobium sp.]|jgi:tetratricopeptide (TPR) repeat protein|nr:hypothetical protein [Rhizomicrobium sp.]